MILSLYYSYSKIKIFIANIDLLSLFNLNNDLNLNLNKLLKI